MKTVRLYEAKVNPRRVAWTIISRKMRKKGVQEDSKKISHRKRTKVQRGFAGATVDEINAKKNEKPESRAKVGPVNSETGPQRRQQKSKKTGGV